MCALSLLHPRLVRAERVRRLLRRAGAGAARAPCVVEPLLGVHAAAARVAHIALRAERVRRLARRLHRRGIVKLPRGGSFRP